MTRPSHDGGGELLFILVPSTETAYVTGVRSGL
jgi:hypothetical protein